MSIIRSILALALIPVCFSACGDDSEEDDFFTDAEVVDITLQESTIEVGEGTVVAVEFSFDPRRVFDDEENISVVVRLPEGVQYREGTAEIDGLDDDESIGAQVTKCPSGESYLLFDIDEFDLDEAFNPPGESDAAITLTIDGTRPVDFETIEAVAGDDTPPFSCGGRFFADEQAAITVVP